MATGYTREEEAEWKRKAILAWGARFVRDPNRVNYLLRYNGLKTIDQRRSPIRKTARWLPYHACRFEVKDRSTGEAPEIELIPEHTNAAWMRGWLQYNPTINEWTYETFVKPAWR